jgi:HlyD family secretion protein
MKTPQKSSSPHERALRRATLAGTAMIALFAGTVGIWAATTTLSGAVVATGQFVVDSNWKKVQHPTGGVVGELRVREGDFVNEGDLLIRLDETVTRANLQVIVRQLDEFYARLARLQAERDDADTVELPEALSARASEPEVKAAMDGERNLFRLRRTARLGQKDQLSKRVVQAREEIRGLAFQQTSVEQQLQIIEPELRGVRDLYNRNLVQLTRLNALQREQANLVGRRGQIIAAIAQAEGRIAETELQILQIDSELRSEVSRDMREVQAKVSELVERRVAAEDQLKRVDIRSPSDGYVHQLAVHTVGGVMTPADPAMLIVPKNDGLALEARVMPQDIDQLHIGQKTIVKLHAFNQRTTPELNGVLGRIGADVSRDQQTGMTFYTVRVTLPREEVERLEGLTLLAGMQADVFVQTNQRTPLAYLWKPLADNYNRAFRER